MAASELITAAALSVPIVVLGLLAYALVKTRTEKRAARPGEVCFCGAPARIVWRAPHFGELGSCGGAHQPRSETERCPFCGILGLHATSGVCEMYRVRPEWAQAGYPRERVTALWEAGALR